MKCRNSAGYTILEVMIVLAVSGALFVSSAILLSGKQRTAQFGQAMHDIESKLQTIASNASDGYYPNGFTCTVPEPGAVNPNAGGTTDPGGNQGCMFLGNTAAFGTDSITTLSVVGRQFVAGVGSAPAATLADTKPVTVTVEPSSYMYKYGLEPIQIYDINLGTSIATLVFMSQLGAGVGVSNPLTGGGATLLYGVTGSTLSDDIATTASRINTTGNLVLLTKGARICLSEGTGGMRGEIMIGSEGNKLSTTLKLDKAISDVCKDA